MTEIEPVDAGRPRAREAQTEDLVQVVASLVLDWLRPRSEDGPAPRRVLWLRWTAAILVPLALFAVLVWLALGPGPRRLGDSW